MFFHNSTIEEHVISKGVFVLAFQTSNARSYFSNAIEAYLGVLSFHIFHWAFDLQPQFVLKQLFFASRVQFFTFRIDANSQSLRYPLPSTSLGSTKHGRRLQCFRLFPGTLVYQYFIVIEILINIMQRLRYKKGNVT